VTACSASARLMGVPLCCALLEQRFHLVEMCRRNAFRGVPDKTFC
jgi:hypothetical protein